MQRKTFKRMNDGGSVWSGRDDDRRSGTSSDGTRYVSKFESLKKKYPDYSWGSAPTDRDSYKSMMGGFKDWRKGQEGYNKFSSYISKKFPQYKDYISGLPRNANDLKTYLSDFEAFRKNKTTPANPSTGAPPPGLGGKVLPASNKWSDIVGAYFPAQQMKAGGLVRGSGRAQRGKSKGRMV
jgi:hypothetical protein